MAGKMTERPSGRRPAGVVIFGTVLIFSSLVHMHKLFFDYDWYIASYGYWPTGLMVLRYCFSWGQRILGLMAGIGILRLKDIGRKIAIVVGWFTILTIYWKHPYAGFKNHTAYLDQHLGFILKEWGYPQLSFSQFTLAAVITACLWDILFFGSMIYYLTRPTVKAQFR